MTAKLVINPADFVAITGDTMTGQLEIVNDAVPFNPVFTGVSYGVSGHGATIGKRADGTEASPSEPGTNLTLNTLVGFAYHVDDFKELGRVSVLTDTDFATDPLSGNANANGKISFQVRRDYGALTAATITSLGNVGIGTDTPLAKMHIVGGVATGAEAPQAAYDHLVIDDNSYAYINLRSTVTGNGGILFTDDNRAQGYIKYSHSDDSLQFRVNNNDALHIDSAGNVGIGTANPTHPLHVYGDANLHTALFEYLAGSAHIQLRSNVASSGFIQFGDTDFDDAGKISYHHGSGVDAMRFWTNRTEKVRIDKDGNVGIGTDSPGSLLELWGTGRAFQIGNDSNVETYAQFAGRTQVGHDPTYGAYLQSGTQGVSFSGSSSTFGDAPDMRIDTAGNVGIGTDSPETALHLYRDTNGYDGSRYRQLLLENDNVSAYKIHAGSVSSNNAYLGFGAAYNTGYDYAPDRPNAGIVIYKSGKLYFCNDSGLTAGVNYTPTEVMVIDGNGNVGIGTDTPSDKLHVEEGTVRIINTTDEQIRAVYDGSNYFTITAGLAGLTTFHTRTGGGAAGDFFFDNGNVGIGTTSPGAPLEVNASINYNTAIFKYLSGSAHLQLLSNPASDGIIDFGDSDADLMGRIAYEHRNGTDAMTFYTNGAQERLRIDYAGNVGIGTDSPSTLLELSKDSDDGTDAPILRLTNASNTLTDGSLLGTLEFYNNDASGNPPHIGSIAGIANASDERTVELAFSTALAGTATERLRIDSAGNVGIGTTTPDEKLHVEGNLQFPTAGNGLLWKNIDSQSTTLNQATSQGEIKLNVITANNINNKTLIINQNAGTWNQTGQMLLNVQRAGVDQFTVDKAGVGYFAGNVGIGTSTPDVELDVAGDVYSEGLQVKTGSGTFTGNVIGNLPHANDSMTASFAGTFAVGASMGAGGTTEFTADQAGAVAMGYNNSNSSSGSNKILSKSQGTFAQGYTYAYSATDNSEIRAGAASGQGFGSFAQGSVFTFGSTSTTNGSIYAKGDGTFAQGAITIAFVNGDAQILAEGKGAFSQGYIDQIGKIKATGDGALSQGYVNGAFDMTASGKGSLAHGLVELEEITASGHGAFAVGYTDTATAIEATADNASQFGPGTNSTADSLQVGEGSSIRATGSVFLKEKASADADVATSGQLWVKNDDGNVLMYTDGDGNDFTVDLTAA